MEALALAATGLPATREIELAWDGRIFFTEHGGALRVIDKES
ncbi:hypothetical protein Elgi_28240 [Paenibacillus elgii]|nr:hypothetical protein Elgi_28240 [Paenibacillus elgii]